MYSEVLGALLPPVMTTTPVVVKEIPGQNMSWFVWVTRRCETMLVVGFQTDVKVFPPGPLEKVADVYDDQVRTLPVSGCQRSVMLLTS